MKNVVLFILLCFSLSSCVSTKKYEQIVHSKSKSLIPFDYSSKWISVDYTGDIQNEDVMLFNKNRVILALFYYNWNVEFDCALKTDTRFKNIQKGIYKESRLHEIPDSIEVHLNIVEIPGEFSYIKKGFFAGLNLFFMGSLNEDIFTYNSNLIASYKVYKNGEFYSNGSIKILSESNKHSNKTIDGGQYTLSKSFIKGYLKIHNQSSEELGRELFNQVYSEITQ